MTGKNNGWPFERWVKHVVCTTFSSDLWGYNFDVNPVNLETLIFFAKVTFVFNFSHRWMRILMENNTE
jgi:hypothetical protein